MEKEAKKILITTIVLSVVISAVVGGTMGFWAGSAVNSQGILEVFKLALTGKDNTKNDLALCKIIKACEGPAATSTAGKISSAIASTTQNEKVIRPWLGVHYVQINQSIADANKLGVNYGALVVRGEQTTDLAVSPGSPADKAGIVENDIILSLNSQKLDGDHSLFSLINNFKPGDIVTFRILHKGHIRDARVKLGDLKP